jgi:hypothetical protein
MTTLKENRNIMQALAWFIAACVIAAVLLGCSPYAELSTNVDTPTPAPSVTATAELLTHGTVEPTPRPTTCRVSGTVYLRADPSRARAPLAVLRAGQSLEVIQRGAWLKVSTGTATGFIYSAYCR